FDTIYHEHFSYFSFATLARIFEQHGLRVFDVEELSTHGGSLRVYACHAENGRRQHSDRVGDLADHERRAGYAQLDVYTSFGEQGLFTRTFDADLFAEHGLSADVVQCSSSFNSRAATLRGLHYQIGPDAECKLVRCTAGAVYDVFVDLRPDSPTHRRWHTVEL